MSALGNSISLYNPAFIGNSHNYFPGLLADKVLGRRTLIQNTRVDLWEGPTPNYVFPTVAQKMNVVSTSANDTVLGTGARTVHIHYLDANYQIQAETIVMNGLAPVTTVGSVLRVNSFHVTTTGSTGTTQGNISLTNLAGTVTYSIITASFNYARQAVYTVPAGYTGYIQAWRFTSGSTGGHFCQATLRATSHAGVLWPVMMAQDEIGTQNGGEGFTFTTPINIPATADVIISTISDAAAANVTGLGMILGYLEPL